jgi:hypothetical protein
VIPITGKTVNSTTPRILGIIGSPHRNGNTHLPVDQILTEARSVGATVDTVCLGDLTIRECDGCHACWHGKPCSKKDDMNGLISVSVKVTCWCWVHLYIGTVPRP